MMAKLYKTEMYILDVNEDYSSLDEIVTACENRIDATFNYCKVDEVSFEWNDNLEINKTNCTIQGFEKYFK